MFGGMEEMQKKMQAQMQEALTAITVEAEAGGGLVKIKANAAFINNFKYLSAMTRGTLNDTVWHMRP